MENSVETVLAELRSACESSYKAFNERLIPTKQEVLGVRMPLLRKIAKRIARHDPFAFVEEEKGEVYELILLEGLVLSSLDKPFQELLPHTEAFLEKVDNWAQVDTTVGDFRRVDQERDFVLRVVKRWLASPQEFVVRAGLVVLLKHFINERFLPQLFELSRHVTHPGYYVTMGNAWLLSSCMAKYPDRTLAFLRERTLDPVTHNRAIQKSRESHRVSEHHKSLLIPLKYRRSELHAQGKSAGKEQEEHPQPACT